jgi:dTDP-4-amino-4,6-dideoxy-D-galactose acyltransferase
MTHTHELRPLGQDREHLRAVLLEHWPWSPLDFIREISVAGDLQNYIGHLTRELDPANDLRFIQRDSSGDELAILAERLPWDSNFFGFEIARLHGLFPLDGPAKRLHADYHDAVRQLQETARQRRIKYLFAQVDPRDLATLRNLTECGFGLIETRSYYHRSLRDYYYPERFPARQAGPADADSLGWAARDLVNQYDRFHADPFIPGADADRMMEVWARVSVLESFADATFVPDSPEPTAFMTVKYHQDKWEQWGLKVAQPVFAAISPEFRGWYQKLLSEISYHLVDIGAEWSFACSQVTNRPALRVFENLGYRFGRCEHVLRVVL